MDWFIVIICLVICIGVISAFLKLDGSEAIMFENKKMPILFVVGIVSLWGASHFAERIKNQDKPDPQADIKKITDQLKQLQQQFKQRHNRYATNYQSLKQINPAQSKEVEKEAAQAHITIRFIYARPYKITYSSKGKEQTKTHAARLQIKLDAPGKYRDQIIILKAV